MQQNNTVFFVKNIYIYNKTTEKSIKNEKSNVLLVVMPGLEGD